jgi:hypothetical protein
MLNFLGIGAQKSGTSWLHNMLAKHPKIAFPGGKEIHFWNRPESRNLQWYSQLFSDSHRVNGEITPAYGILPAEIIHSIHAAFPHLRLIYLMRNPIDRAWSSAKMALGRAEMVQDEASDQWFIDHFNSRSSLARGDYESCIRNWRSVYPSDQILLLRYEMIEFQPVALVNTCLNHLGLEDYLLPENSELFTTRIFAGDATQIRPRLLETLSNIYSDQIESLSQYLEQDFSEWKPA